MKQMFKGKVNSPATLLVETIDSSVTSIKVADGSVFPEGPNVAVIGTDGNAETIKYDSINGNILVGCVRGFQGKASVWDKDTIIARNFTEYDLDVLQENILELNKKELKDLKSDSTHRTVTDSDKEKWNDKVSQSQITSDANATGSNKIFSVDFILEQFNNKIDKSQIVHDYTGDSEDKIPSLKAINIFMNNFDKVKADKSKIPTKISELTNDKNFKTETEIQELINNSTKLKKEIVTSLPSTGKEDVIYLLKNKNDTNNYYTEYMWINGKWEIIGDTKVDLSGYLKTVNLKSTKLRTNKNNIRTFTDRSTSDHQLDIILGDLELRTEENKKNIESRAKSSDIKTKLSEMEEDSTHKTVTDSEKQSWNKKSRSATFVIANYDSSENSKAGADYVIQENESPCDIINSFIEKLPSYGGKIQLTEGHFIEKNDKSINLNKDNITLSGYGESTNLERTIEGAKIEFIKIFNSNIILENFQSNPKNENAVWFSETTNKCKLFNILGTSSTLTFSIKGSNHSITNCSGTSINNSVFNTFSNSNNHQFSNCSGTSTNDNAFSINGSNHQLSNCTGTSTNKTTFYINGSNHRLSNCTGTSTDGNVFNINGSGISLVGCIGENNPKESLPCFWIGNKGNKLSNCSGTSTNSMSFYINGSNHQLSNCTGTSTDGNAFNINGSGISLVGCIGETKNPNRFYDIILVSETKSCIVLGNFYHAGGLNNKGTNNVLANNIKLEV
ncbi:MAG: hypothetical protein PUG84_00950 [Peptoniphilaceae bacterium]|nr:hypothetical protein [Peptoniphilaceae bacterium]